MVFVLLTYGGWNEAAYVSAEVRGGPRAIVRCAGPVDRDHRDRSTSLFVAGVLHGLGFEGLKASQAVGVDVIERAFGRSRRAS